MKTYPDDLINPINADIPNTIFGLTKREHFASIAMQAWITKGGYLEDQIIRKSVNMAERLINELNIEKQ